MTGTFLKVLMAASALVPVAATAQRVGADVDLDARVRGGRVQRVDAPQQAAPPPREERVERFERAERPDRAERPQREQRAGRLDRTDPAQRPQRADLDTRAQVQASGDARFDRGRDRDDRPGFVDRPGFDRRADAPGRFYRDDRDRAAVQRDRRDGRQVWRSDRRDDGRRFQSGQRYGGYGNGYGNSSGYGQSYGRSGYDDRRAWNRDWRNDRRYAWSDYRTANRNAYRLPRYYAPNGWSSGYRRFGIGVSLNTVLFDENYWIQDPYTYRLPEPYGPYRWVRYYNDALLVDLDSGRVVDTVYDIFW